MTDAEMTEIRIDIERMFKKYNMKCFLGTFMSNDGKLPSYVTISQDVRDISISLHMLQSDFLVNHIKPRENATLTIDKTKDPDAAHN